MKKRFLVVEDSFIGMKLIKAEDKQIVEIEVDVDKGGMTPGSNLVEVDEDGNPIAEQAAKPKRAPKADGKTDGKTDGKADGKTDDLA
jgi:hypothetical protein